MDFLDLGHCTSQCGDFTSFLSFKFNVKSILENLNRSVKTAISSILNFAHFGTFQPLHVLKWQISHFYNPLNVISRKIEVIEKSEKLCNFHTVQNTFFLH